MNQEKDNVLDTNEEFWDLTDDKVIWDGAPNINENLYIALLVTPILLLLFVGFLVFTYTFDDEIVIYSIFAGMLVGCPFFTFIVYDFHRKLRRNKFVLLSKYLVIRAGDRLTTKGFRFTNIKDVFCKNNSAYVSVVFKNKMANPFNFINRITDTIKIGPFDNAEGVADILKDYILNTPIDYSDIDKKSGRNFWKNSEGEILWEGKPMLKDWTYYLLRNILSITIVLLILFFLLEYFLVFSGGFYVLFLFASIFLAIVFYQLTVIRRKSFYRLGTKYLYVRAGYRLIDIRFDLLEIRDVRPTKRTNKIKLILNKKIRHPFKYVRDWSNEVDIGPFENSDEVFEAIQKQIDVLSA